MYPKTSTFTFVFLFLFFVTTVVAEFPVIERGDLEQNDERLAGPIDRSGPGEVTIASFNVRNLGARRRGFRDFEALIDLVDEADIVLFQEVALGVYDDDQEISEREADRLSSIISLFEVYLREDWTLVVSPNPSGAGNGAESSILAYRNAGNGLTFSAEWKEWVDLGPRRDMAVFELIATPISASGATDLLVGSVHLKPTDPLRGEEMNKVADWMIANGSRNVVVCGDFNWGYANSGSQGNQGEIRIRQLHDEGKVFQVFRQLSYLENDTDGKLRTNMGFRKTPRFYDQILTTPTMAARMADGGSLLEDCGMVAFGVHSAYMAKVRSDLEDDMKYGLGKFLDEYKQIYEFGEDLEEIVEDVERKIESNAAERATYYLSDHRVIWVQFRLSE